MSRFWFLIYFLLLLGCTAEDNEPQPLEEVRMEFVYPHDQQVLPQGEALKLHIVYHSDKAMHEYGVKVWDAHGDSVLYAKAYHEHTTRAVLEENWRPAQHRSGHWRIEAIVRDHLGTYFRDTIQVRIKKE